MTTRKSFQGLLFGSILLLAASAFAADKVSITTYDNVNIGGKQLKAGDYNLQWDGNGPDVQLNVMHNKTVLATVPAHVVTADEATDHTNYSYVSNSDGSRSLTRIQPKGKKIALEISGDSASAAK